MNQESLKFLNKPELRRMLVEKRRSLPEKIWREQSNLICDRLQSLPVFREARTILAYFSFHQEPDLGPLFSSDRQWGFSRCVGKSLIWHFWEPGDKLQIGAYGIKEPSTDAPLVPAEEVDLVLVPAVACDYQGYRLGYGGGFYDQMLSSPQWINKSTIGIIFDFAYLPQLPVDSWDIKLHHICTN